MTDSMQVAIAATKHLTPVTLELGGKDPAIILPETDLNKWAPVWLRGVLYVWPPFKTYQSASDVIAAKMPVRIALALND